MSKIMSLDNFIILNNNDKELINEIDSIFENSDIYEEVGLNADNYQNCSILTKPIILPNITGLLFFRNFNILQCANVIIPDIFRVCFSIPPPIFEKNQNFSLICPKIGVVGQNTQFNLSSQRIQRLLPDNIIYAFLYFGYSSNLNKNIAFENLVEEINSYILSKNNNPEKYYDVEYIFNTIYTKDTLLQQILGFNSTLKYIRNPEIDGTNFCNFNIKWLFSYYCYTRQVNKFKIYNNFQDNNQFSYSDLTLLNYVIDEGNENFSIQKLFLFFNKISEENPQYAESIKIFEKEIVILLQNNVFKLIKLANEVKSYIYEVIQNILSNKVYQERVFSTPLFFNITEQLYSNYVKNELFIQN